MILLKKVMLVACVVLYSDIILPLSTDIVHLIPDLQQQIPNLNSKNPFVSFSLGLSDEHKQVLQMLKFDKEKRYNRFDNFSEIIPEVTTLLKSLGNNDHVASTTATIIHDIVIQILSALNFEAAWVAVRCFKKQDSFVIPRWHTDGEVPMVYKVGCKYKIACTLKGPGTLFCNAHETLKKEFYEIQNNLKIDNATKRQQFYNLFKSLVLETAPPYTATVFLIGDDAAIHSEPDIDQDRLYLGILPGTKEQIKEFAGS